MNGRWFQLSTIRRFGSFSQRSWYQKKMFGQTTGLPAHRPWPSSKKGVSLCHALMGCVQVLQGDPAWCMYVHYLLTMHHLHLTCSNRWQQGCSYKLQLDQSIPYYNNGSIQTTINPYLEPKKNHSVQPKLEPIPSHSILRAWKEHNQKTHCT